MEISGIPALNFDADEGVGYGAILALYGYQPGNANYAWTLQPTVFLTTEGRRDYTLFFDRPSSPSYAWRYTAYVGREQQLAAPYYGVGNDVPFFASTAVGGRRYFYRYGRDRVNGSADVQHALGTPALRVLLGGGASTDRIDLTPFDSGITLIQQELANHTPPDGHTNYLRAGLTGDTRDREVGPHSGTWVDAIVQRVDKSLGASNEFTRATLTVRHYQPLGDRVTLASRLVLQNTNGDVPFYELAELETTQKPQDGLGGASTVRGLPKDRYVGKGTFVSNEELRWRAADFSLLGRSSSVVLSGFWDTGRVWADGVDVRTLTTDLHSGVGGGARLSFGQSFVIAADVGHSSQSTAPVYIGLGYLF